MFIALNYCNTAYVIAIFNHNITHKKLKYEKNGGSEIVTAKKMIFWYLRIQE